MQACMSCSPSCGSAFFCLPPSIRRTWHTPLRETDGPPLQAECVGGRQPHTRAYTHTHTHTQARRNAHSHIHTGPGGSVRRSLGLRRSERTGLSASARTGDILEGTDRWTDDRRLRREPCALPVLHPRSSGGTAAELYQAQATRDGQPGPCFSSPHHPCRKSLRASFCNASAFVARTRHGRRIRSTPEGANNGERTCL